MVVGVHGGRAKRVMGLGAGPIVAENTCPTSAQGESGPQGLRGPMGPTGPTGPQGPGGPALVVVDANGAFVGLLDRGSAIRRIPNATPPVGDNLFALPIASGGFVPGFFPLDFTTTDCTGPQYGGGDFDGSGDGTFTPRPLAINHDSTL